MVWTHLALRVPLLPLVAVIDLLKLPWSVILHEPSDSDVWGARASLASAEQPGAPRAAAAAGLPGTVDHLWPSLFRKPDVQLVWGRVRDAWNAGLQFLYTALFYNVVVAFVKWSRPGLHLTELEPKIRAFMAARYVGKYTLLDRRTEFFFSIVNSFLGPDFTLVPGSIHFPFNPAKQANGPAAAGAPNGPGAANEQAVKALAEAMRAHVCAVATIVAYEEQEVVRDIVIRWGFQWLDDQEAEHISATAPRTYWYAFYNEDAVILCFRGTAPINLLNWQTNIDLGMTDRLGHGKFGKVHRGWYEALFGQAQNTRSLRPHQTVLNTVFERVVHALQYPEVAGKPIYICGHSLGGSFAVVTAMGLAVYNPEIEKRIAGVLTVGQPHVGDEKFVHSYEARFLDKTLRYVHGCDIVPRVPAGFGYKHHRVLRYIPSFGIPGQDRVIHDPPAKEKYDVESGLFVALRNGFRKLKTSQARGEPKVRTFTRKLLLPFPGIMDHGDYVTPLREDVDRKAAKAHPQTA